MQQSNTNIVDSLEMLRNKNIYVACSGGVDSIVLLHALYENDYQPKAIHVNYHLRDEESNDDQRFVEQFCKQRGIPLECRSVDLKNELKNGGNLQEKARNIRYDWFKEIIERGASVALAHHADDQIETFFLNMARNAGIMGLAAMPKNKNGIYRPFLAYSKEDLINYAKENNLEWREDSSNASNKYRRNILRNKLLPELNNAIPTLNDSVKELIYRFQQMQSILEQNVGPIVEQIKETKQLKTDQFGQLDQFEKVELMRQLGLPISLLGGIEKLVNSQKGKRIELRDGIYSMIVKESDHFNFISDENSAIVKLNIVEVKGLPNEFSKEEVYLDPEKLHGDLKIRPWRQGDRIAPVGMKGQQLISDIIAQAKVPADQKPSVLVVHDDSSIHWCVGLKVGRKALANEKSHRIIRCTITHQKSQGSDHL